MLRVVRVEVRGAHDSLLHRVVKEGLPLLRERMNLYSIERCGLGAWSTPDLVIDPAVNGQADDVQSIQYGRPSLALNRQDKVAHLVFVQSNATNPVGGSYRLLWSRKPYTGCP